MLGDFDRIVQGRQQHACNPGHLAGFGGEPRQERHQLDLAHPFAEVMLAGRHRVPAPVERHHPEPDRGEANSHDPADRKGHRPRPPARRPEDGEAKQPEEDL